MPSKKLFGRLLSLIVTIIAQWYDGMRKSDVERELAERIYVQPGALHKWYRGELPKEMPPDTILAVMVYALEHLPANLVYVWCQHIFPAYARYQGLDAFPDEDTVINRYFAAQLRSQPLPSQILSPLSARHVYVERACDRRIHAFLARGHSIVTVKGAYQSGKTALLMHLSDLLAQQAVQSIRLDFNQLGHLIDDAPAFYPHLAAHHIEDSTGAIQRR